MNPVFCFQNELVWPRLNEPSFQIIVYTVLKLFCLITSLQEQREESRLCSPCHSASRTPWHQMPRPACCLAMFLVSLRLHRDTKTTKDEQWRLSSGLLSQPHADSQGSLEKMSVCLSWPFYPWGIYGGGCQSEGEVRQVKSQGWVCVQSHYFFLSNTLYAHNNFLHRIKAVFTHMCLSTTRHLGRVPLGDLDASVEHSAPSATLSPSLPLIWHLFLPPPNTQCPQSIPFQPSVICSHSTLYFSFPDVITIQILLLPFQTLNSQRGSVCFCSVLCLSFWHDS